MFNEEELIKVIREDSGDMRGFVTAPGWRVLDKWLLDREQELIDSLVLRSGEDDLKRGQIKALRYLRNLPQVILQIGSEPAPPETDSAETAHGATAQEG